MQTKEQPLFTHKLQKPITISYLYNNQYKNMTVKAIDILEPKVKHLQTLMHSIEGLKDDFVNANIFNNVKNQAISNPDYGQTDAARVIVDIVKHTVNAEMATIRKKMEDSFISLITCSTDNDGVTLCRVSETKEEMGSLVFLQSKEVAELNGIDFKEMCKSFFFHYTQVSM